MGYQSPNFDTFKYSGENLPNFSCLFSNHWSVFLQNLHNSSVSWKITHLYFCSWNNIYFGQKEPIKKSKFLDFSSARVKFCEVHVNFKTTSQSLFNFCIILHFHDTYNWYNIFYFDTYNIFYFRQKHLIKVPISILSSALVKIPHATSKQQVSFSSNFASLLNVMKDNSSVLL